MTICERCSWFIPTDCTCRRRSDELAAIRLKRLVADRHREAVARAYRSGWPVRSPLIDGTGRRDDASPNGAPSTGAEGQPSLMPDVGDWSS
jgi:hypothetical protein